jgi:adenylate cyclase
MNRVRAVVGVFRGGLVELARPGEGQLSGRQTLLFGIVVLPLVIVATNVIGAGVVLVISLFVVPLPEPPHLHHIEVVNAIWAACYVGVAVPVGVFFGTRGLRDLRRWLLEERAATPAEARGVLHAPLRLFVLQVSLWFGGAVLFGVVNDTYNSKVASRVVIVVAITGLVTASTAYLLTERLLRTAAARALSAGSPARTAVPGVATRTVLAWAIGSGLPVLGTIAIGIIGLTGDKSSTQYQLALAMVVLGGIAVAVGLLSVTLAARTTADPIDSVRRALANVQRGDFDVRVPVYDATQIGQLQLGFNQMVAGLQERERIREAFGTYVDPDVAEHVLKEGTDLAGEEVEVTIMFIDIRDFTGFAEKTPAPEIVAAINGLFGITVPIIHKHGGRVDKFVGDGLMAVFGAPGRQPDHADRALKAALEIEAALGAGHEQPLKVGIGLNSGRVVAGNIGGDGRFEFGVIGDAVNVAARVEAATRQTGDTVLIAEHTKRLLRSEHPPLEERHGVELKGKTDTVRLYAPKLRTSNNHMERANLP